MSILIRNGTIVTMEKDEVIKDGGIYIEGDRIVDIGPSQEVARNHNAEHVVDATSKLILPGFIDAHNHTDGDSLFRGGFFDTNLEGYLTQHKWPSLRAMSPEDFHAGALLGYANAIRSGTTVVADNYYGPRGVDTDGVPKAAAEIGIRSILCRGYHDYPHGIPEDFIEDPAEAAKEYGRLFERWDNKAEGRIRVWVSPVNLPYNTGESVIRLHELAVKHHSGVHTHVSENTWGVEAVRSRFGKDYMEAFQEMGVLGSNFVAAHGVLLSDREIELVSGAGATVVHNPASNMIFGFGVSPVPKMIAAGVNVALGTDSFLDMVAAMKLATSMHKVVSRDPLAITAREVLRMATINGARAYGLENELGSLRVGKKADVVIVNLQELYAVPVFDPIATLVYFLNGSDVETVIIDGKFVMREGVIQTVDAKTIMTKAQQAAEEVSSRMHSSASNR
jgi:5-methylthioadenosine/S-adenosylhomocysteine deaminase